MTEMKTKMTETMNERTKIINGKTERTEILIGNLN